MIKNDITDKQYNIFRENIKNYRKELNLSQEQLAEKADVSVSYIKQIESSKEFKNVSLIVILKISRALNTSIDKLFVIKINQK